MGDRRKDTSLRSLRLSRSNKRDAGPAALGCTSPNEKRSPVQVFVVLHVEQHGRDELVHVLRLPDDGLQLVVHRLPDHALQAFDPGHTDPAVSNRDVSRERRDGTGPQLDTCLTWFWSLALHGWSGTWR